MSEVILGVFLSDKDYAMRLSQSLSERSDGIQIIHFIKCNDLAIKSDDCDLIIMDEKAIGLIGRADWFGNKSKLKTKVILLKDDIQNGELIGLKGVFHIYKYERLSLMLAHIKERYYEVTGKSNRLNETSNIKILSFCGTSNDENVTATAIEVARQLSFYENKKVMYMNLSSIDSSRKFLPLEEGDDIRKLFLSSKLSKKNYLTDNDEKLVERNVLSLPIDRYISKKREFDCLCASSIYNYISNRPEELEFFIKLLDYQKQYDYLVLDIGYNLRLEYVDIVKASDKIFVMDEGRGKNFFVEKLLEPLDGCDLEYISVDGEKILEGESSLTSEGFININPMSAFANEIKKIIGLILQ